MTYRLLKKINRIRVCVPVCVCVFCCVYQVLLTCDMQTFARVNWRWSLLQKEFSRSSSFVVKRPTGWSVKITYWVSCSCFSTLVDALEESTHWLRQWIKNHLLTGYKKCAFVAKECMHTLHVTMIWIKDLKWILFHWRQRGNTRLNQKLSRHYVAISANACTFVSARHRERGIYVLRKTTDHIPFCLHQRHIYWFFLVNTGFVRESILYVLESCNFRWIQTDWASYFLLYVKIILVSSWSSRWINNLRVYMVNCLPPSPMLTSQRAWVSLEQIFLSPPASAYANARFIN